MSRRQTVDEKLSSSRIIDVITLDRVNLVNLIGAFCLEYGSCCFYVFFSMDLSGNMFSFS